MTAGFLRRQFHQGRGGRAKLAISTSVISRIVGAAISLLILPISVRYLGNEGYGLMTTITAVVGWLQFTNLGIGLGLQNALTEETAKANRQAQKELVSTAVLSLAGIGLILLVAGLLVFPHIRWTAVFPPTTERFKAEIPWTVLFVFFGFVSTVMLGFVGPIYAARQELHIGSVQAMVTSLVTLLGTVVAVHFRWGLLGLTICTIGATAVMQWSFALWTLYGRGLLELHPRWSSFTRSAAGRVYRNGIDFLLLQICNIAFFQIDAFLIVRFLTVDQVTPYSVAQKVFMQTSGLFAIVAGSLWPAYGHASAQGDTAWVRRIHRKLVQAFLLVSGALAVFMVLFGHRLFGLWVGSAAAPSTLLIAAVAMYFLVRDWTGIHATLLNGLNIVRPQVWNVVLMAILTLVLDLLLVQRLGPLGLAIGGFIAFSVSGAWYFPYLTAKALNPETRIRPDSALHSVP